MIWHLIDSSSVGGAERHVATLAETCSALGIEIQVVLLQKHGYNPWLEQLTHGGVSYRHLDGSWRHLVQSIREQRPLLIHTHGYKAGLLGRSAARLLGIPVVSTFHSGARSSWPVWAYEWADEWSAFLGESIAVSPGVAARLPWRASVMSSFVRLPPNPVSPALPAHVAFVGRLSPEKNPERFCELAASSGDSELSWNIYGDGPMRADLEARYGHAVHFHGAVSVMDNVWPKIGLLIMPSRFEGVPLAALEAMSFGVPVLASPVGGLRWMIKNGFNGWHFPTDDPASGLAEIAAWKALTAAQQCRLRETCRCYVAEHFSPQAQFGKLKEVYQRAGLPAHTLDKLSGLALLAAQPAQELSRDADRPVRGLV